MRTRLATIWDPKWSWAAAGIGVLLCLLLIGVVVRQSRLEGASPDHLDLGTVKAGSTLQVSARFLTAPEPAIDRLFAWGLRHAPATWRPALAEHSPKAWRRNHPAPLVILSELKPVVHAPAFVEVEKVTPQQRKEWYGGWPFIVLTLKLNCSQPGDYRGEVKLALDDRRAVLPIRVRVRPAKASAGRVLIVPGPYVHDATDKGSDFQRVTEVLSKLSSPLDCLDRLPERLGPYRTILLSAEPLIRLSSAEAARLHAFVRQGGRLLIACDAFFHGTVPGANQLLTDYGLEAIDKDYAQQTASGVVPNDPLTRNVRQLRFWRPVLIHATNSTRATILAPAPNGPGGFLAVHRLDHGGGEVLALGESLWWHWPNMTNSDNSVMLENLLQH